MPYTLEVKKGAWGAYGKVFRAGRVYEVTNADIIALALKAPGSNLVITELTKVGGPKEQEPLVPEEAPESDAPVSAIDEVLFVANTDPVVSGIEEPEDEEPEDEEPKDEEPKDDEALEVESAEGFYQTEPDEKEAQSIGSENVGSIEDILGPMEESVKVAPVAKRRKRRTGA